MSASLGIIKCAGYDIVTHVFQHHQAKGTVFIFHGLYDHVGIYNKPIGYFLENSYSVVAYDLPGHGVSSGQLVSVKNFYRYRQIMQTVCDILAEQVAEPWYAVAQSTGGAVLIDAMLHESAQSPYPFNKTVLLAPLIRPQNWERNRWAHSVISRFVDYVPRKFTLNSHDEDFLRFLREDDVLQSRYLSAHWVGALKRWIPKIESARHSERSVLVVQGQEDTTVDWKHNMKVLHSKFQNLEVCYLPAMRHQVVNEIDPIRNEVFELARDYLDKSQSG
ncbi:MAG: alpha/beta hydrolase [Ketobacteraceae bacterium]|nr:alpha/beta hydrolase [Ketobacteraceae bacterium]